MFSKCCSNQPGIASACVAGGLNQVSSTNGGTSPSGKCAYAIWMPSNESTVSLNSAVSGELMLKCRPLPARRGASPLFCSR